MFQASKMVQDFATIHSTFLVFNVFTERCFCHETPILAPLDEGGTFFALKMEQRFQEIRFQSFSFTKSHLFQPCQSHVPLEQDVTQVAPPSACNRWHSCVEKIGTVQRPWDSEIFVMNLTQYIPIPIYIVPKDSNILGWLKPHLQLLHCWGLIFPVL